MALISCAPAEIANVNASCSSRISPAYSGPAERNYCTTNISYTTPAAITGQATFRARPYTGSLGLGAIGASQPIRYAEVIAYDSSNNVAQCTETDGSGNFSLNLPTSTSVYTVKVFSRGNNSTVKASVLNCPEENIPYSISGTVTPTTSMSMGTINADADNSGELLGAAFNIFDQIVNANLFLASEISSCPYTGCSTFTVAPKVQAYWEKGFNPNDYFSSSSGISFYIPSYRRLFILGGIDGDIYNSDTDHFDNSVILHEYGHFLEDALSNSDSPGGSHNGNGIIDPRLAWSEGWGNFFQAAVRSQFFSGSDNYRDTIGTPNTSSPTSTSAYIFNIPLEAPNGSCGSAPGCDIPVFDYEGNFREFSITRALWDIFDSPGGDDDSINNNLVEVWATLTSSLGFLKSNAAFLNIGLLYLFHDNNFSGVSDWSSIYTQHKQGDSTEYGRYVAKTGGCGKVFSLNPYDDPYDNGSFATSHLVRNNEFLHYKHIGGAFSLQLKYLTVDNSGGYSTELEPDLDLWVYNESAELSNSSDVVASSETYWDNDPNTEETESLSKNLPAGDYLINVRAFTGQFQQDTNNGTNNCVGTGFRRICENDPGPDYNYIPAGDDVTFQLILNGVDLCPTSFP